jgi:predicted nucleic acid-binding Zn ribbon protein
MPIYSFECKEHGKFEELISMEAYGKLEKIDGVQHTPCEECKAPSPRVYDGVGFGRMGGHYTGGHERSYNYVQSAEENWLKDEVKNIKEGVLSKEGQEKSGSPYAKYTCTDPEAAGLKKTDAKTAKQRMEAAKKTNKAVKATSKRLKDENK